MNDYRAYVIGDDGHIVDGQAFQAVDDITAVEHATRFVTHHDVEVWQGARRVGILKRNTPT